MSLCQLTLKGAAVQSSLCLVMENTCMEILWWTMTFILYLFLLSAQQNKHELMWEETD